MIDLHTHTTASDGTLSPSQLVDLAARSGLEALAITDHDTLAGFDEAAPVARDRGLDLVCAIELSTRQPRTDSRRGRSVHLLGYFPGEPPKPEFREWLRQLQQARRDRNERLVERLRELGVDISIDEVRRHSRHMTGRPHFARVLLEKGYVSSLQEAFDEYLDESAKGYVQRMEPSAEEGIRRIREGNGLPVIAHPIRLGLRDREREADLIGWLVEQGLEGIEVWHSDHQPADETRYLELAERHGLVPTGGSDFHGELKPRLQLGRGTGKLDVSREVLVRMRSSVGR